MQGRLRTERASGRWGPLTNLDKFESHAGSDLAHARKICRGREPICGRLCTRISPSCSAHRSPADLVMQKVESAVTENLPPGATPQRVANFFGAGARSAFVNPYLTAAQRGEQELTYGYAGDNPLSATDPNGDSVVNLPPGTNIVIGPGGMVCPTSCKGDCAVLAAACSVACTYGCSYDPTGRCLAICTTGCAAQGGKCLAGCK